MQATNDYYRNIYADPLLGPIFKVRTYGYCWFWLAFWLQQQLGPWGHLHTFCRAVQHVCLCVLSVQGVNMVVLRTHVAYFINQVRSSLWANCSMPHSCQVPVVAAACAMPHYSE